MGRAIKIDAGEQNGRKFIGKITELSPNGGGDWPEMAFKGIIEALKAGPENGSPLYVWTDAPPKDATPDNILEAKTRAKMLGINVYFFLTTVFNDPPSSVKPFEDLANYTCGQVFELPKDSSSIAKMKRVTKHLLGGTSCSGGLILGNNAGKKKRSVSPSVYRLLVDNTMEKIIVTVSSENSGATINLKDPLGNFVTSEKSVVFKVTIFELENRSPGIWQLVVPSEAGKHTYLLKGSSRTNVVFDFIFVIPRQMGRPLPIPYPLKGELIVVSYLLTLPGTGVFDHSKDS